MSRKRTPKKRAAKSAAAAPSRPWALAGLGRAWRAARVAGRCTARAATWSAAGLGAAWGCRVGAYRPAAMAVWGGLAAGALGLTGAGLALALPSASGEAALRLVGPPPAWVATDWADAALAEARGPLYAPGRVAAVGRALAASPWIAQVDQVCRTSQGLVARCRFRTPRFLVERGGATVCLDARGVRLPDLERRVLEELPMLRLLGLPGRAPEVGAAWSRPEVRAAVRVADALYAAPAGVVTRLRAIECTRVAGYVRVYLHAAEGGARIEWGVAGGGPREVPEDAKVRHLVDLLRDVPSFRTVTRAMVWTSRPVWK